MGYLRFDLLAMRGMVAGVVGQRVSYLWDFFARAGERDQLPERADVAELFGFADVGGHFR